MLELHAPDRIPEARRVSDADRGCRSVAAFKTCASINKAYKLGDAREPRYGANRIRDLLERERFR